MCRPQATFGILYPRWERQNQEREKLNHKMSDESYLKKRTGQYSNMFGAWKTASLSVVQGKHGSYGDLLVSYETIHTKYCTMCYKPTVSIRGKWPQAERQCIEAYISLLFNSGTIRFSCNTAICWVVHSPLPVAVQLGLLWQYVTKSDHVSIPRDLGSNTIWREQEWRRNGDIGKRRTENKHGATHERTAVMVMWQRLEDTK